MLELDYMKIDSLGNFCPSASITRKDAVYALLSVLGYKPFAQELGGRDNDYMAIATKIGLLKSISIENPQKLSDMEVAELLVNAMGINVVSGNEYILDGFCLWDRLNLTKKTGKILANSNYGLVVEKTDEKHVNIDGKIYYTDMLVENDLVGSTVTYYTQMNDGEEKVVSIFTHKNRETVTIRAKDIDGVIEDKNYITISYDRNKKLKFLKSGYAIVNGKTQSPTKEVFEVLKSGQVTFLDSNGNGAYDVAHITLLIQDVLDGVNVDNEIILTRFEGGNINLSKVDTYELYLGKKSTTLSELKRGMIVGIACDSFTISNGKVDYDYAQAEYIRIYASSETTEGIVTMFENDYVTIDDLSVKLSSTYYDLVEEGKIPKLELGDYIIMYRDYIGEGVYYEIDRSASSLKYGYLIAAGTTTNGLKKSTSVKVMDENGTFHILESGKKFVLDGSKVPAGEVVYTVGSEEVNLKERQLVRFRAVGGELKELDTKVVRAGIESEENTLCESLEMDPYVEGHSKREVRKGVIANQHGFRKGVIMFRDEAQINDTDPSENKFSVSTLDTVEDGSYYISGYNEDDMGLLEVCVSYDMYGVSDNSMYSRLTYYGNYAHVVVKIKNSIDKEGNNGWKMTVAGNNMINTYFVPEDDLILNATDPASTWDTEKITVYSQSGKSLTDVVAAGDVIFFSTDSRGNVNNIDRVFDFSVSGDKNSYQGVNDVGGNTWCFTKVERMSGDYCRYTVGTSETYLMGKRTHYNTVPVYNVNSKTVEMMRFEEVPSAVSGSEVRQFARFYDRSALDHIFYVYE